MFALTPFNKKFAPAMRNRTMRDFDNFFENFMAIPDFANLNAVGDFDLYEEDGNLHLSIEAPGFDPKDLEIVTTKDSVAIRSKKETEEKNEKGDDGKTWYSKKSSNTFNYSISLPFEIDIEKAEASFDNGVIKITAPKIQTSESKVLSLKG